MENPNDLLTTEEAAKQEFGGKVSPATMQWWRVKGRGPRYMKIGRRVVYRRCDLRAYIEAGEHLPAEAA